MDRDAAAPDGRLMPLLRRALTCLLPTPNRTTGRRWAWRCGKALTATTRDLVPPTTSTPHCGVRSRAIFSGPAGEKRQDGPVIRP